MAFSIDTCYLIISFWLKKNQAGSISPDRFNLSFNAAQREQFNWLSGNIEQWQYSKPAPRIGIGYSQVIEERLAPFIVSPPTLTIPASGQITKPLDLVRLLSLSTSSNTIPLKRVSHDRIWSFMGSVINPVSSTYPIFIEYNNYYQVYPTNLGSADIIYLRMPKEAKWAYTLDTNGRPIYDPANSINPEWKDVDINEILIRQIKQIGISIREQQLIQYARTEQQVGE